MPPSKIHRVLKPGGTLLSLSPDKSVWHEGHCGVPFLHWVQLPTIRRLIPKLADPDSRCMLPHSIAKTYGGPMGYGRRAQARTVPRMS